MELRWNFERDCSIKAICCETTGAHLGHAERRGRHEGWPVATEKERVSELAHHRFACGAIICGASFRLRECGHLEGTKVTHVVSAQWGVKWYTDGRGNRTRGMMTCL